MDTWSDTFLDYAAGNWDGDGCVVIGSNYNLTVGLDKATKGKEALELFVANFGGKIYSKRAATSSTQQLYEWKLNGPAAMKFILAIKDRVWIKRQQAEVASRFPMALKCQVKAEKDGVVVVHESKTKCANVLGLTESQLRSRLAPRSAPHNGWKLTEIKRDDSVVIPQKNAIDQELRRLKHVPHEPITKPLTIPYCAGLVDAEGCLSILNAYGSWKLGVPQGSPEILYALQRQFAGSVFVSKTTANRGCWQIYARLARPFLEQCLPYMVEKKKQVELVLAFERGRGLELNALLRELKGNYTAGLSIAKSAVPDGMQLPDDMVDAGDEDAEMV